MATRGVVVAGGRGERLGLGIPKALAMVGGITLLERALRTLARCCDHVVVAAPAGLDLPVGGSGARAVTDRAPGGGPLAGVVAALEGDDFERALVLGVDFPLAREEALAALLARLADRPGLRAVVPAPEGRLQPLFAAYTRAAAAPLRAAFDSGERSLVKAVDSLGPMVLAQEALAEIAGGPEGLFNLNRPGDLAEAERRLALEARRS